MEVNYTYLRSDIAPIMRANGYWRSLGWVVVVMTLAITPSALALWVAGLAAAVRGGLVAFAVFLVALHWMLRRVTRRNFLRGPAAHRLAVADGVIEHSSDGRWHRSDGGWIRDVRLGARYLAMRGSIRTTLIPRRAFAERQQADALAEMLNRLEVPAELPLRPIAGEQGATVEFQYTDQELDEVAQQRFSPREGGGSIWWLLGALFVTIWLLDPSLARTSPTALLPVPRIVGVLAAVCLPVPTWMLLKPLRRKTFHRVPEDMQFVQRIALWSDGMEHSSVHFQSFLEWRCLQRVLDGRDYIVFYGDTGGWSALPRRALGSFDESQDFLEEVARRQRAAAEAAAEAESVEAPLPPRVETGNPYQPPAT